MSTWSGADGEFEPLPQPHQIPVDVGVETCALAITPNALELYRPISKPCWGVLASWLPSEAPLGMFVAIRPYVPTGESERALGVHSLWAVEELRGPRPGRPSTLPIDLGRWFVTQRLITHHSPDRTIAARHRDRVRSGLAGRDVSVKRGRWHVSR